MRKLFPIILIAALIAGCGKKYPIPPEPSIGGLPPLGSYVKDINWPGSDINFQNVKDVIVGKDGFIYVLDGEKLVRMLVSGNIVETLQVHSGMNAISQGLDRILYVAGNSNRIFRYYSHGNLDSIRIPSGLKTVTGIALDGRKIIVADSLKDIVISFIPDSVVDTVATFGQGVLYVDGPIDVWVDPYHRVLTVSYNQGWVEAFPTDSLYPFLHFGGTTPSGGETEREFSLPQDVVSDDSGYIYIAVSGGVLKYDFLGEFVVKVNLGDMLPVAVSVTSDGKYLIVATRTKLYKFERFDGLQQGGGD